MKLKVSSPCIAIKGTLAAEVNPINIGPAFLSLFHTLPTLKTSPIQGNIPAPVDNIFKPCLHQFSPLSLSFIIVHISPPKPAKVPVIGSGLTIETKSKAMGPQTLPIPSQSILSSEEF
jgi:hypothetical protein